MRNYLVVDGGGTKTLAVVCDETGKILGKGLAGGSNASLSSCQKALDNLLGACNTALRNAKLEASDIVFGNLFIPGFKICLEEFEKKIKIKSVIIPESEALKYSAFRNEDGIVVLSGTGSFSTAFIGENKYSVGAWGDILGDEGSGYDIGLRALKECTKLYDDKKESRLLDEVAKFYEVEDFLNLRVTLNNAKERREKIASLSPLVCRLASEGEDSSIKIIEKATDELASLAYRAYLKSGSKARLPVTLTGGVKKAGSVIIKPFKEKILKVSKGKLYYSDNNLDIIYGAILKTLKDDGIAIDEINFEV
ncbi:MAG: BadF/BadG/BcrA/BcrD ATPase family protein [Bacilli bacterium]|nr:BadF/BadG/BcrA/BcrD ATPase family protein [Bacilli bacterium]